MPERDDVAIASFNVVFDNISLGRILYLLLFFLLSTHLKGIFRDCRGVVEIDFVHLSQSLYATSDVTSNVGSFSVVQLSDRQREICKMIKKDPRVS